MSAFTLSACVVPLRNLIRLARARRR